MLNFPNFYVWALTFFPTLVPLAVFETIKQTQHWANEIHHKGGVIAFVPTMGALHLGHISLIEQAKMQSDAVISSIFVNPTQFNNASDLVKYPRTLDKDIAMLEEAGCHALFAPDVSEVYPKVQKGQWDFGPVNSRLEGHFRPGHFDGVCTVVKKLFEIVTPDKAFFGEKDFQQLAVIRKLVDYEGMKVEVIGCPTLREMGGLAMSSRNMRLNESERKEALAVSRVLFKMKEIKHHHTPKELEKQGRAELAEAKGLQLEYLEIVDGDTFEDINDWSVKRPVALFAGYCGGVRLIDNIML